MTNVLEQEDRFDALSQLSSQADLTAAKILVVDDEQSIIDLVTAYLDQEGYSIRTATDGFSGLKEANTFKPDLVVLDIMLPGLDGLEVLGKLRRESDVYVILLTAKSDEIDKIVGLSVGADDYLTKPFSPRELVARIKAALRRLHNGNGLGGAPVLNTGRLRVDIGRRRVWVDDRPIELTTTEFGLLETLVRNRGLVLSREQLLEHVWGHDFYGETRVVDVHIGHIRRKLGDDTFIDTVRGVGYRLEGGG